MVSGKYTVGSGKLSTGPISSSGYLTEMTQPDSTIVLDIPNPKPTECDNLWCVHSDSTVRLRLEPSNAQFEPLTVHSLVAGIVSKHPRDPVLGYKKDPSTDAYTTISYSEYYQILCQAARSFIKLGLKRFQSVGILGFNSVEWVVSSVGAIFAGGFSCGIYSTNSPEACQYIASHASASIIVVEDTVQLNKILAVRDSLPELRAIIQYKGEIVNKDRMVHTWKEFMEMGRDEPNTELIERLKDQRPNHCCSLIYTSGTTGNPKGVLISHDNLSYTARTLSTRLGMSTGDRAISYLPLSHIAALISDVYLPLTTSSTMYFAQPDALRGSLGTTLKEVRPTIFFGVPRVWEKMQEKMREIGQSVSGMKKSMAAWAKDIGYRGGLAQMNQQPVPWGWTLAQCLVLSKIRNALGLDKCHGFFTGAAPITKETLDYFLSLGIPIKEVYGLSETTGPNCLMGFDEYRISSVGHTLPGSHTSLKPPIDRASLDSDVKDEVCMYGRNVFMGYLEAEEKSREVFDSDGWFHSGDVGKFDAESFLYITGRIKELIITAGGENVAPVPIEDAVLVNLPCVANAMLIGDKKKFLSMFLTLKSVIDMDTQLPTDTLTPQAQRWMQEVGCQLTSIREILAAKPEPVMKALQAGIDLTNKQAVSRAQIIQKWAFIPTEFSLPGGELGPTMKVRRAVVAKQYDTLIDEIYAE